MRLLRWMLIALGAAALASAGAQTIDMSLSHGTAARIGAELAVTGLREADTSADLSLGVVAAAADLDAVLAARWSRAATLGLLGAVSLDLEGALRTDGHLQVAVGARGVLGPASVGVALAARTHDPEAFSVVGLAPLSDAPRLPGTVWSAAADVRYRIDRQLLLGIETGVFGSDTGLVARLEGSLRARRVWGDVDALAAWHGWYDAATNGVVAGAGGGVVWAPRRAPEWRAVAWLGLAEGVVHPGVDIRGRADLSTGVGIELSVVAQPFRRDVPPLRALAELTVDVAASEIYTRAQAQSGGAGSTFTAALALGARIPIEPR